MNNEYIIVNKTAIEKRIEELEVFSKHNAEVAEYDSEGVTASELKEILSQSKPLIPEIEKAFNAGIDAELLSVAKIDCTVKDYISNLKLDI